ncbi:MAG TPA: haloacid dehalogenase type II [Nocardioidaceae bacterium]|jgi:2-haloacid dehalogenase|nr:haloacid dehalogenase type II [Nocardioidaceae bacterium]
MADIEETVPSVVVFDVNETLSDLSPLGARFVEVGASASAARLWFASVLRDGFALTAAGDNPPFAGVARELLLTQLAEVSLNRPLEDAARHVMDGFSTLELHADVASGIDRLHEDGLRLATLSNGSAAVAERLLSDGHVRDRFERLLSVEDAGVWKPARGAYRYAADQLGTDPAQMVMVACHPWDIDGARRAGMRTAWVNRSGGSYPATFGEPTYTVAGIDELPDLWG